MTNVKISELPPATTPLTGSEIFPLVQDGVTRQAPIGSFTLTSVAAVNDLLTTAVINGHQVLVGGYAANGDGGGGTFYGVTGAAPGTYTGNGGTVIVPTGGDGSAAWLRIINDGIINVRMFGAVGDGVTDDQPAIQAAIDALPEDGALYIPYGVFAIESSLDLTGKVVRIYGDGYKCDDNINYTGSAIKATAAMQTMFDLNEASDAIVSPFYIDKIFIDCNDLADNGMIITFRHDYVVRDVAIYNALFSGATCCSAWIGTWDNCRFTNNATFGIVLGSNKYAPTVTGRLAIACNNVLLNRCGVTGDTQIGVFVGSTSNPVTLMACDIEFIFGSGATPVLPSITFDSADYASCVYLHDVAGVDIISSYLGDGSNGPVIVNNGGAGSMNGGILLFGYTSNTYGVKTYFNTFDIANARISGQAQGAGNIITSPNNFKLDRLFFYQAGQTGRTAFQGCVAPYVYLAGDIVLTGDPIARISTGKAYSPSYGVGYSATTSGTVTVASSAGSTTSDKDFVVSGVSGSASVGVSASLIDPLDLKVGAYVYLVVTYASTTAWNVRLADTRVGTAGTNKLELGTLPSTANAQKTYLRLDKTLDKNVYVYLEFYKTGVADGDTLVIFDVTLSDNRFSGTSIVNVDGSGDFRNLYKC